jgi:hypothetical protein
MDKELAELLLNQDEDGAISYCDLLHNAEGALEEYGHDWPPPPKHDGCKDCQRVRWVRGRITEFCEPS